MATAKRPAGVQDLLPLEDIIDGILCLRGGDYRAVLEAQSINFALKSESEQEGIIAGYKAFLNSLGYPLQVIVRILPTDVEAYLNGLRQRPRARGDEMLRRLALDHEAFVRRLARERSLLERRFYIVIPAGLEGVFEKRSMRWPWQPPPKDIRRNLEAAAHQLDFRAQEVLQALASFGVSARRLSSDELSFLWSDFLRTDVLASPPLAGYRPVVGSRNGRSHHND
ncbi:MAG TPA: hypothetical protein VNN21_12000 [Dehalococcoidia bacterium]|nr:hypothetical protein [Dehalococcoidia bacterium]